MKNDYLKVAIQEKHNKRGLFRSIAKNMFFWFHK